MKVAPIATNRGIPPFRALSLVIFLAAAGALFWFLAGHLRDIEQLYEHIDRLGAWGPALLILTEIAVVVLVVPGIAMAPLAGFFFGAWLGAFCIVFGTVAGASAAYFLGRHIPATRFRQALLSHRRLRRLNDHIALSGWKFVLMTRLVPIFPFKLSNYYFGMVSFPFRDFLLGTALGILPITVTLSYTGSLAKDLATLRHGGGSRSPAEWGFAAAGLILALAMMAHFTRVARRRLVDAAPEDGSEATMPESASPPGTGMPRAASDDPADPPQGPRSAAGDARPPQATPSPRAPESAEDEVPTSPRHGAPRPPGAAA